MTVHLPPEPPSWLTSPAPVAQVYQREVWTAPPRPPKPKPTGPRDATVTTVLLGLSLIGTLVGVITGALINAILRAGYEAQGIAYFETTSTATAQLAMIVSHILLFGISAVVTILLRKRKRMSFYVPLAAGIIAAILYWTLLIMIVAGNHDMRAVA
jgi:hypothetical protein